MRLSLSVLAAAAWVGGAAMCGALAEDDPLLRLMPDPSAQPTAPAQPMRAATGSAGQAATPATGAPVQAVQPVQAQQPRVRNRRKARVQPDKSQADARVAEATAKSDAQQPQAEAPRAKPKAPSVRKSAKARSSRDEVTAAIPAQAETVGLLAAPDGTQDTVAEDLAAVLGPDVAIKVIPGKSMPIKDVLSLPNADVAVTSGLSLARGSGYANRLVAIADLFTEELHAVGAADISRPEELAGKTVFLGPPGSDGEMAARAYLEARGIAVKAATGSLGDALARLRQGELAAVFVLAPKPFAPLAELKAADGVRLLPLAYRSSDTAFYPAALTAADYPGLVEEDGRVETVALDAVLIAPWWRESSPRQKTLTAFTTRLFARLSDLQQRHPKWQETNLAVTTGGVRRLKTAAQWVSARLKGAQKDGDRDSIGGEE